MSDVNTITIITDDQSQTLIESKAIEIIEIQTPGVQGAKGDTFVFDDLTQAQIDQLKADLITTASEIDVVPLTPLNNTLSATNVQDALEEIETKTIYGGSF